MDAIFVKREGTATWLRARDEEERNNYLRVLFDEIDMKKELMEEFICEEVVDYILTLFDERGIREMLFMILYYENIKIWPINVFIYTTRIPDESKPGVLKKIAQIYLDNSMRNDYRAAKRAYWNVRYGTFSTNLFQVLKRIK